MVHYSRLKDSILRAQIAPTSWSVDCQRVLYLILKYRISEFENNRFRLFTVRRTASVVGPRTTFSEIELVDRQFGH